MLHTRWVYDHDLGGGGGDNNCGVADYGNRGGGDDDGGGNDCGDDEHYHFCFRAPRLQQSLRLGALATGVFILLIK